MARPVEGSYACIMLLHERYGLVRHTEDLAMKLAGAGYVVMAPDLFYAYPDQDRLHRGEVSLTPSDTEVLELLDAASSLWDRIAGADTSRLGMIGVCQTGRYAIVYGAQRPVRACVSFYGAAQERDWQVNPRQPVAMEALIARLQAPLLGIFGEKDHVISVSDVQRLRGALEQHRKSYRLTIYADAPHGWLNDTMPGRYRPQLAAQAWGEMVGFLAETLNGQSDWSLVRWEFSSRMAPDYDFGRNLRLE